MATVTLERRNDIAKLLTTLATPCGSSCSEHDWHKCQRCLLIEALSERGGLVFDLLREGAAALASPPAEDGSVMVRVDAMFVEQMRAGGLQGPFARVELDETGTEPRLMVQREPTPDSVEWWRSVAAGLGVEIQKLKDLAAQAPPASDPPRTELDNHHNALRCPYCNPKGLVLCDPAVPRQSDPPGPAVINEDDGDVTIDFDYANDRVVSIRLGEESSGLSAFVDGESHALCPLDRVPPRVLALLRTEAKAVTLRQSDPPGLVARALADRDRRPWRYYDFDKDALTRMLEHQADKLAAYPLPASPQAKETP